MLYRCIALVALTACNGEPVSTDPGDPIPGDPTASGDTLAGDPLAGDPLAGDPPAGDPLAGDPLVGDPLAGDPGGSGLERCGLDDFSWLPGAQVGGVVTSTKEHDIDQFVLLLLQSNIESESGVSFARLPEHDVDMVSLRYTTQDRGAAIEATAMVLYPDISDPTELPLLLWLHGTSGLTDLCAPSLGIDDAESDNFQSAVLLALFASYGYIVVAPDYIGMKASGTPSPELHPYLVAEATALASWDALRATEELLASETGGDTTAGRVAIWGASQGGHAAAFTVRFGPHYAPEYDVAAAVYAIPPTDVVGHAEAALTAIRSATGNMVLFFSAAEQWYRVPDGMAQVFVPPYDTQLQPDLMASCSPTTLDAVTTLEEVFTPAVLAAAQSPGFDDFQPWACIARENSLTTTSVERLEEVPALFIQGEDDTLVDPAIERAAFATLCSGGMRLWYLECQGAGHTDGALYSIDDALDFIEARLDGDPLPAGMCQVNPASLCSNTP